MREIFDSSWANCASFANALEVQTCFAYPLFFVIGSTIGNGTSMLGLSQAFFDSQSYMGDIVNDLGIFMENHDNKRWLTAYGPDKRLFENAITLVGTWTGIPFNYYGCEQDMVGGIDPENRVPLWKYGYN